VTHGKANENPGLQPGSRAARASIARIFHIVAGTMRRKTGTNWRMIMNENKVKVWLAQAKSDRERNVIRCAMQSAFEDGYRYRQGEIEGALVVLGVALTEDQ